MARSERAHRRLTALLAGAILLLQGLVAPMLESSDGGRRLVLESEHSSATCPVAHDHSICLQIGANRVAGSSPPLLERASLRVEPTEPTFFLEWRSAGVSGTRRSRAPPIV